MEEIKKVKTKVRRWDTRRIAFVSILIATSVAFILVFSSVIPIASLPTFKLTLGGLPIKLTGYIFGPMFGLITGVASDLISFMFRPTFIHWWYTIAFAVAGFVPGVIGYTFNRKWRSREEVKEQFKTKYNLINTIIALLLMAGTAGVIVYYILSQDDANFKDYFLKSKYAFLGVSLAGFSSMFIGIILFRLFMKPETYNRIIPIIAFSTLLEFNTVFAAKGDIAVNIAGSDDEFLNVLTFHMLLTPSKIWFNLIIISFAYKIVSPLISNKTNNGW